MGLDDGIEWFGGGFDASNIIVTGAGDDALDFDLGFQGKLQNVFIQQDPTFGDSPIEISNNSSRIDATPVTKPVISNLTSIASGVKGGNNEGFRLKEGAQLGLYNSIAVNNHDAVFTFDDRATLQAILDGDSVIMGNILNTANHDSKLMKAPNDLDGLDASKIEKRIRNKRQKNKINHNPNLPSINWGSPSIKPTNVNPCQKGVELPEGFVSAPYRGAVNPASAQDWTQDPWVNYSLR